MRPVLPRRFCCDEEPALIGYEGRSAASDLCSWQTDGPRRTTQELIDNIVADGVDGAVVLDIGAGVGAIHVALLEAGAKSAVDVDASREYLATARAEADRRGLTDRIDYRYGDLVELAGDLPAADIVTLDSVICCYPYLARLIDALLTPRPRLVGFVHPRDVWWMRAFMRFFNLVHSIRRSPDGYFIHRQAELDRLMSEVGFVTSYQGGTRGWRVVVYRRAGASA